jgi:hypothetical protein
MVLTVETTTTVEEDAEVAKTLVIALRLVEDAEDATAIRLDRLALRSSGRRGVKEDKVCLFVCFFFFKKKQPKTVFCFDVFVFFFFLEKVEVVANLVVAMIAVVEAAKIVMARKSRQSRPVLRLNRCSAPNLAGSRKRLTLPPKTV